MSLTCFMSDGCWGWAIIGAGADGGAWAGTCAGGGGGGGGAAALAGGGAEALGGEAARPRRGMFKKYSAKQVWRLLDWVGLFDQNTLCENTQQLLEDVWWRNKQFLTSIKAGNVTLRTCETLRKCWTKAERLTFTRKGCKMWQDCSCCCWRPLKILRQQS